MRFSKYEGLGNDFIVIEAASSDALSPERVVALCDRRFGVGADGVLLVLRGEGAEDARMRVLNADGSVPEMCGNGLRCVALHLARAGRVEAVSLVIGTDAGPRACEVLRAGEAAQVSVDMGEVRSLGAVTLDVDGAPLPLHLADAGNPHAIAFGVFTQADVARIGPLVERHSTFPRGTNVEFACVHNAYIDLVVWERGVGVTLACGTGACATARVARGLGLVPASGELTVRLPGGTLRVDPREDGPTRMVGPARYVFGGDV